MSPPQTGLLTPRETPNDEASNPFGALKMAASTVFRPDAQLDPTCAPDLAVLSSDCVLFYAHSKTLLRVSTNAFSGLLPASPHTEFDLNVPIIRVRSADSTVLDLVLHAIYGLDMAARKPTLEHLSLAVESLLVSFAVPPLSVLAPGFPLFKSILAHAVVQPLHVYSLAAHYYIDALAVAASAHTLSFPLLTLTDDYARAMGAVYLRRLFGLHMDRVAALRGFLMASMPPAAHAPSVHCNATAWALAVSVLVIDARPDTSQHELEATLGPHLTGALCSDCRRTHDDCTQKLVSEWSAVKATI